MLAAQYLLTNNSSHLSSVCIPVWRSDKTYHLYLIFPELSLFACVSREFLPLSCMSFSVCLFMSLGAQMLLFDAPEQIISIMASSGVSGLPTSHNLFQANQPQLIRSCFSSGIMHSSSDLKLSWCFLCFLGDVLDHSSPLQSVDAQCTLGL